MRRRARECAVQILYHVDVGGRGATAEEPLDEVIARHWGSFEAVSDDERAFAERLVKGVMQNLAAVDDAVGAVSENWRLERMGRVDLAVLRLAAYEILWCPDIPRAASINEAVDLAKRFSGREAAAFINGVLDKLDAGDKPAGSQA